MPSFTSPANITIEYDTFGSPNNPAMLFVMGFTAQMTAWPVDFMQRFADAGFYVIRFDNRDCGLSTKLDGVTVDLGVMMTAMMMRDRKAVQAIAPYTLSDMAADAIAVLDHLQIDRAHIVGASMGGMIVQTMAIEHPARVATMTSIMSTTGEPDYGQSAPEAQAALLSPAPTDRAAYIEASVKYNVWASKKYVDVQKQKQRAAESYDRSFYPEGSQRQLAAILASEDRREGLEKLQTPSLVIHGLDDTLITPSGGQRTAELIPGANYLQVKDMGHDLPEPLWPLVVGAITGHAKLAS